MLSRKALGFGAAALMIAAFSVWAFSALGGNEGSEKGNQVLDSRPAPLPSELGEEEKRAELLRMRSTLCKDLQLLGAGIINVGILPKVPPRIMEITGMPIDDLEAEETAICGQTGPPENMSMDEEHRQIETLIAAYRNVLSSFEAGEADAAEVIRAAESVRLKVGLHFAKEEQSVIRPMQQMRLDETFKEVIQSNDRAIGPWLKEHGWICETCSQGQPSGK